MRTQRDAATAAFQFLSRFPIRRDVGFSKQLLQRSVVYYPLVGAAIGLCTAAVAGLFGLLLPPLPTAVLSLIVWVALTGGLHLDGWMDTADGLLSYRSRERMLEIMKDSRVGAMGVLACVLLLLLKASLLAAILADNSYTSLFLLVLAPVWSRWAMVRAMVRWPIARGDEGLAANFAGLTPTHEQRAGICATLLSLAAAGAALALGGGTAWPLTLAAALLLPVAAFICGNMAAHRAVSRLGGLTGDVYGALNELLEAVLLLVLAMLQHILL
ncbi:adenosylcobinamide-GDP ribazoletransferase [Paenibacillus sp. GCM10012306]|uniref:adenosylcobinamide-GDP ribazoletransferase n=1 Tax=Paenibacillus sp. GCM10012306 TaxID=3317342 RepID=UPI0036087D5B